MSISNEVLRDKTPKLSPLNDKHLDNFLQEDSSMSSHDSMSSSESDNAVDKKDLLEAESSKVDNQD